MTILFLEPDKILGKTYSSALEHAGHMVTLYQDAQSVIRAIDKQSPDLVIAELQLAGHNGIEFLYELRSYTDLQSVPVMVLSHVPPHETGMSPKLWDSLGIVSYYYKPHTKLADLISAVNRLPITQSS